MLIKEAIERRLLYAFIRRSSGIIEEFTDEKTEVDNIRDYRGFLLTNQTSVLFSSEPDISVLGPDGRTRAVIEIKGGADPAGALERYGAAKKSFELSLRDGENMQTILVASCITSEVEVRIKNDSSINVFYNLTEILSDLTTYQRFTDLVFN